MITAINNLEILDRTNKFFNQDFHGSISDYDGSFLIASIIKMITSINNLKILDKINHLFFFIAQFRSYLLKNYYLFKLRH